MIDATDKIVMPGLVNAHMHTWETALRGIGAEWMTADYLRHMHLNLATRYRPEDNYLGNLIGALGQIDGGVTTLVDWCHNITSIELAERAVDGLIDSGIRAVFAHGTAKPPTQEGGTPFTHVPHPRDRIESLRKGRLASDDGRVTLAMAILGPDWGAWEVVEHDIRMARELGLVSSSHTRRREDCVVPDGYARMAKAGLLGPDHNLVHGTSYDHHDLEIVIDSGASLTSTVLVELHHHIGDTQVAAFRAAGGMPSLGIDVEPFCSGQMFREMQAALLFARGREIRNNALRGNSPFRQLPVRTREALEWATIGGARAFMMDDEIGTLSPGKKADIVMLRAERHQHGAGLRPGLFDRGDRRRRQCRHGDHRRHRAQAERQAHVSRRRAGAPPGRSSPNPAPASCATPATRWRPHRHDRTCRRDDHEHESPAARRSPDLSALAAAPALAQGGRTITMMHGFTPGANVDIVARLIAEHLGRRLGQTIVVEPRPGAGGTTAAATVARSAPDGTTIAILPGGHAVSAAIYNKLPYDAVADFTFISMLTDFPFILATYPDHPGQERRRRDQQRAGAGGQADLRHRGQRHRDASRLRAVRGDGRAPKSSTCRTAARRRRSPTSWASASTSRWTPRPRSCRCIRNGQLRAIAVTGPEPFLHVARRADDRRHA